MHDRMSVILNPEDFDCWTTGSINEVGPLLVPRPSEGLEAYPISRPVNNPRNEGAGLLAPSSKRDVFVFKTTWSTKLNPTRECMLSGGSTQEQCEPHS
jgi:hypothetical protein